MANARTALLTAKGTSVWVPDAKEAWVTGTVEELASGKLTVVLANNSKLQVDPAAVEFYSMSAATACKVGRAMSHLLTSNNTAYRLN